MGLIRSIDWHPRTSIRRWILSSFRDQVDRVWLYEPRPTGIACSTQEPVAHARGSCKRDRPASGTVIPEFTASRILGHTRRTRRSPSFAFRIFQPLYPKPPSAIVLGSPRERAVRFCMPKTPPETSRTQSRSVPAAFSSGDGNSAGRGRSYPYLSFRLPRGRIGFYLWSIST